DRVYVHPFNL
nr:angiotensin I [Aquarana catesbeiana]